MPDISNEFPIHITARSNNQDWFEAPLKDCWEVFAEATSEARKRYGFKTHSFLLMSNHYHWLMSLRENNLGKGMCYFQTNTSREIARLVNRINRIYGARYKPTIIYEPLHFANAYRYIYQNPVRAGICKRVEEYPWSTLSCADFITDDLGSFGCEVPSEHRLNWLNTPISSENTSRIRKALRRRVFAYPRDSLGLRPQIEL